MRSLFISLIFTLLGHAAMPLRGLNLPPQQGTTNAGAFLPGVYRYDYTDQEIAGVRAKGFRALRVPVNAATAQDPESLDRIARYFGKMGNEGVICFFDTRRDGEGSHGSGRPNDLDEVAAAWSAIHRRFLKFPKIRYEIFNEPFGYPKNESGAKLYLREMTEIMRAARLPKSRCILDGLGYADQVQLVAEAGWKGDLAYHFYPTWLAKGQRTQDAFAARVLADLKGLSHRVHLTEFGADLSQGDVYDEPNPSGTGKAQDPNALGGLHDALRQLKKVRRLPRSTYFWHGWHNGDSYDYWDADNKQGAKKVRDLQRVR